MQVPVPFFERPRLLDRSLAASDDAQRHEQTNKLKTLAAVLHLVVLYVRGREMCHVRTYIHAGSPQPAHAARSSRSTYVCTSAHGNIDSPPAGTQRDVPCNNNNTSLCLCSFPSNHQPIKIHIYRVEKESYQGVHNTPI
jgi:hypothetical protein